MFWARHQRAAAQRGTSDVTDERARACASSASRTPRSTPSWWPRRSRRAGYELDVALAADRRRFEELLAGGPYDVILADYALPGFDAHGALELAKAALPEHAVHLRLRHHRRGGDGRAAQAGRRRLRAQGQAGAPAVRRAARHRRGSPAARARSGRGGARESRERERFALQGTNDGLWDVRMDTGAVYLSPRGREILGYPARRDGHGRRDAWDQMVCPDDLPATTGRTRRLPRRPRRPSSTSSSACARPTASGSGSGRAARPWPATRAARPRAWSAHTPTSAPRRRPRRICV